MRDIKLKNFINNLSENDDKKRIEAVKCLVEKYEENTDFRNEIIKYLLQSIRSLSDNKKNGSVQSLRYILELMDKETLNWTISEIKEHLFSKDTSSKLKNKLGMLLSIDALVTSVEISKIEKSDILYFYDSILLLVKDNSFGFLAVLTMIKFLKKISTKDIQQFIKMIPTNIFDIDSLDNHPQYLVLNLYFSTEHKKIMKNLSISIPSIQSEKMLDKLPKLLGKFKGDQLISVLHVMSLNSSFSVVWKHFIGILSSKEVSLKIKKVVLLLSFKILFIQNNENNPLGILQQQNKIIYEMWNDGVVLELLFKQLSKKDLELHTICQEFVIELNKMESTEKNQKVLEMFFGIISKPNTIDFVKMEANISQSLRLSQALLRYIKSTDIYNTYIAALIENFKTSETYQEKVYGLEQLAAVFVKCPVAEDSILELLIKVNYEYNQNETKKSTQTIPIEPARSALIRCLQEIASIKSLDRQKSILTTCMNIYQNSKLKSICERVLKICNRGTEKPKSKKRRASECNIDVANVKIRDMFVTLLSHLCFYMTTQQFDDEFLVIVEDIMTCFDKSNGCLSDNSTSNCSKRIKLDDHKNENADKDYDCWPIVFTDVIVALLEQNCHYLRNILVNSFKILVEEGLCDFKVIQHINSIIEKAEVQSRGLGKKGEKEDEEDDEEMDIESNDEVEDVDDEEDDDEEDDDETMDVDDHENDLKKRIFAALESVKADVNSDSDDNCPEVEESESSETDDDRNILHKTKSNLKEQRYVTLQLKQFKNRCIDLLENIFLYSPKLGDRLIAFSVLLTSLRKSDMNVESHMCRLNSSFKKFQKSQETIVPDIIDHFDRLIKSVEKCILSKNLLKLFSNILITLLRLNKSQMPTIVEYFKPIIDSLVMKKNHSMKPVFLAIFNQCPEVILEFHDQFLSHLCPESSKQCNFQAVNILHKILTSPNIKNCVQGCNKEEFLIKSDIESFVIKFGSFIEKMIKEHDNLKDHPKNFSILINCLIDCLKLMGSDFYEAMKQDTVEKLTSIPRNGMPKDFKKVLNQFISAVNFAKSCKNVK